LGFDSRLLNGLSAAKFRDQCGIISDHIIFMVVASKAGEAPVKPIDVWANQTQKSASFLGLVSPLFGATTIV